MKSAVHPAVETYLGLPGYVYGGAILVISLAVFSYVLYRRYLLIRSGMPDPRFSFIGKRMLDLLIYGIFQKRQPRYLWAGVIHLMIFWGFVILGLRSIDLVTQGLNLPLLRPFMQTGFGLAYNTLKDVFELIVLAACLWAILRRAFIKHERYEGSRTSEAYFVLCLISFLMITDMFYEGSAVILSLSGDSSPPASHLAAAVLFGSTPLFLKGERLLKTLLHSTRSL
jgi:hypothetical protein